MSGPCLKEPKLINKISLFHYTCEKIPLGRFKTTLEDLVKKDRYGEERIGKIERRIENNWGVGVQWSGIEKPF